MATILIVEDYNLVRELLRAILTPEYRVIEAVNPAQGIDLARLIQPDLVLLDLNLQEERDGLEVCRVLRRESDPALARIPIVVLTGETGKEDIKVILEAGANSYMSKPYNPQALLLLVGTLLAESEAGTDFSLSR